MTQVTKKDDRESLENLIRRFNRKVQQAGTLANAKKNQYFEKPPTRKQVREAALVKNARKEEKMRKIYLGK